MQGIRNLVVCALAAFAGQAAAATLSPTSYDMPNGDGQASGGTFNYWDRNYTGSGATTTDNSPLSGGLGKLTDGVISTSFWNLVSNVAGTGEYVGWLRRSPTITFKFAGVQTIDAITIHYDNSLFGGVGGPSKVSIEGTDYAIAFNPNSVVTSFTAANLGLTDSEVTLQLFDNASPNFPWVFVSEIVFEGTPGAIPEPSAYALMLAGLALLGATARRRLR